jgi:hypothetical protein
MPACCDPDSTLWLTMLNTAMVRMMAVVMTVRETRGQGRFAMMPDDFKSHMREAEAFLLHCWKERERKGNLLLFNIFS